MQRLFQQIHLLMLFDICCVPVILSSFHMLLSDPYSLKTEKQISFYRGFILVMRHGPYLTLTAAFLFITVAIQVNVNGVMKPFSDTTLNITVNRAGLDSDAQC